MEADSQSLSTQSRAIDIQVNYHIDCAMLYSIYLFNKAGDIEQTANEETILEQRLGKKFMCKTTHCIPNHKGLYFLNEAEQPEPPNINTTHLNISSNRGSHVTW